MTAYLKEVVDSFCFSMFGKCLLVLNTLPCILLGIGTFIFGTVVIFFSMTFFFLTCPHLFIVSAKPVYICFLPKIHTAFLSAIMF